MPEPDVPSWLTTVDPDAAARMSTAYAVDPVASPSDLHPQRASARRIRHAAATVPLRPDSLRAVTYASAGGFEHLRAKGWLGARPDTVEPWLRQAYDWMRWRMLRRIPTATGRYPMWFWPFGGEWASQLSWSAKGDVVLLVDLPRNDVLLSDFDDWHGVLNIWQVTPAECEVCGIRFCETHEPLGSDADDDARVSSWDEVTAAHIEWYTPGWDEIFEERRQAERHMQVTCEILRAEQVVAAFELRRSGRDYRWEHHPLVLVWRKGRRWWWKRRHSAGRG